MEKTTFDRYIQAKKTIRLEQNVHMKIKTIKGDQEGLGENRVLQAKERARFSCTG